MQRDPPQDTRLFSAFSIEPYTSPTGAGVNDKGCNRVARLCGRGQEAYPHDGTLRQMRISGFEQRAIAAQVASCAEQRL